MSLDSQEHPWSDDPGAPRIPYYLYSSEKATFAGFLIGAILYGVLIVLFFQCMAALFNLAYRRGEGIRWGLVSYTTVMFLFATVYTAMNLNMQSTSFIDNRKFLGLGGSSLGPLGYQAFARSELFNLTPNLMFLLNCWLADGLLLYRCYVIYAMKSWAVIVLPCFLYLSCVAMGIMMLVYQARGWNDPLAPIVVYFGFPHQSISVSLNVLLTLMIVIRLFLRNRSIRTDTGTPAGTSGLYKAIVTMLIESSALYAVISLLVIALLVTGNHVAVTFFPILAEVQVIAPLLIIQRVANRSALMSNTIATGHIGSFHARSLGESTDDSGTLRLPGEYSLDLTDKRGKDPSELVVVVGTTIDSYQDDVV